MTALKPGDTFPEDVKFSYIPYTPEIDAVTSCGIPQPYDASKGKRARSSSPLIMVLPCLLPSSSSITNGKQKLNALLTYLLPHIAEFKEKKIVLVAVPGAFTPTCQNQHVTGFIKLLPELKKKGVDQVVVVAYNDAFVMSAWGKANGVKDDSIVSSSRVQSSQTTVPPPYLVYLMLCLLSLPPLRSSS